MRHLRTVVIAAAILSAAPLAAIAQTTNFSYTYLGIELGSTDLDETVVVENEAYDRLGTARVVGSYQFNHNFALSLSSKAMANSGPRTELTQSLAIIGLHFPFRLNTLDIIPMVGYAGYELEGCVRNLCYRESDNSLVYGADLRLWAVPDTLEFGFGYTAYAEDELSREVRLEGAIWAAQHHRFSLKYYDREMSSTTTLGYHYHW